MSPRRHISLLLILATFMIASTACGRHDSDEKYFLVTNNVQLPYWQEAKAGFMQASEHLRVQAKVVGPDTYDAKAELAAFEDAVKKKPAGILISVADPAVLMYSINNAITAGIPVITIDADAPVSKRLFFVGTNNYQAGLLGGKRLAEELKDKGNVVFFTIPEQANLAERLRGYREALGRFPDIHVVRVVDIAGDPRVAFDTATEILGKESDKVNAFVCLEAQAGREVATVLNNRSVKDKVVIAMDTDADTLDWIDKGVIAATISQKPYTMSLVGLHMLDDLYHNKLAKLDNDWSRDSFAPIPAFVDTGTAVIDKSNIKAFREAKEAATKAGK
ncbi:MAG TPA: substrate-binding domain-containing protein [Terriglobales bacterium]|jgi:ribose transport system substrate-binding protein|nr:substrate-binding domain-containing protein [Terriglobales bacterium]